MKPPAPSPAARDPGTEPPGELGVAAGCRVWGLRGWAPRRAVTRGIPPPPGPAAPRPCSGVPACPSGWPCARGDPAGRSHPESLAACLASRASPDRKFGQVQDKARWLEMLRKPTAILFFFFFFFGSSHRFGCLRALWFTDHSPAHSAEKRAHGSRTQELMQPHGGDVVAREQRAKRAEHGHVQAALARAQLLPLCLGFPFSCWALSFWCSVEFCLFQPKPSLGSHPQGPSVRPRAGSCAGAQGGWNEAGQGTQWLPSSLHIPTALPPPPRSLGHAAPRARGRFACGFRYECFQTYFLAGISGFLQFLVAVFL